MQPPPGPPQTNDPPDPPAWGDWPAWGDQGDGTYRNPVLPADYSDIDCIRVGSDYYAISSTFQFSPGMVILHSRDLVNWSILGHAVSDLTQISPALNWDHMNRAGRGIWAGALCHHAQKFWLYFGTPDEGYFMTSAANPAGPWAPLHPILRQSGWDDCCAFWDDDGLGYFVGTHFSDHYKTFIFKMTPDGRDILPATGQRIHEGLGREASKLLKVNGWYYHFFSEHQPHLGRYVMMQRSNHIMGPYTEVQQLSHASREANEPNQGGIVQTESGDWYFLTHHGTGAWEGRAVSLLPVTWLNGWPILGEVGPDGIGRMVWTGQKPLHDQAATAVTLQTADEFDQPSLAVQWEWHYQPRPDKWSLAERPGWLRLHAFKPLEPDTLLKAGNTLTQRSLRTRQNQVTIQLDLSGMAGGQHAGLCHFSDTYSMLGVNQHDSLRRLVFGHNADRLLGPVLTGSALWLRSVWGLDGTSRYSYSLDGQTFTQFGEPYILKWGAYRGDRIGLYCYNDLAVDGQAGGYIDIDFFHYTYHRSHRPRR